MRTAAALLLLAGLPSPVLANSLASGSAPGIPWLRLLLSMLFCIALAWGAVVLLKQYQKRGMGHPLKDLLAKHGTTSPRRIAIIETRRASLHADLCLIECDEETYLLALTPTGATVINRRGRQEAAK